MWAHLERSNFTEENKQLAYSPHDVEEAGKKTPCLKQGIRWIIFMCLKQGMSQEKNLYVPS